jgi:hypothetical protein
VPVSDAPGEPGLWIIANQNFSNKASAYIFFACLKKTETLSQNIEISIPFELSKYTVWQRSLVNKYETNQVIKALDTWLVLKHETTSGFIQSWNQQKKWLLQLCKCSETIFRLRLKLLQSMGLIKFDKSSITICSWEKIGKSLNINTDDRFTIKYNINDKQRVQEWIIATEIVDNKESQDFTIITKLEKNAEQKMLLIAAMIAAGADRTQLDDMEYFLRWMRILYHEDFIRLSDLHNVLTEIRPDNNRGVRGISKAWNAKSPQTVSYWKKILRGKQIIDITSLQIESRERSRNKYCRVLWLKNKRQTLLCLCDQITILQPWLLTAEKFLPAA